MNSKQRELRRDIFRAYTIVYPPESMLIVAQMPSYELIIEDSSIIEGYIHYEFRPYRDPVIPFEADLPADSLYKIQLETDISLYEQIKKLKIINEVTSDKSYVYSLREEERRV